MYIGYISPHIQKNDILLLYVSYILMFIFLYLIIISIFDLIDKIIIKYFKIDIDKKK